MLRPRVSTCPTQKGLWIGHHDEPVHYRPDEIDGLSADDSLRLWKGRNPAYPDLLASFHEAVADSVLSAWDHPARQLVANQPAVPSSVIPVEFTNCNAVSIGADLQGRERLDQVAWLVFFTYENGRPRVIALVKEG